MAAAFGEVADPAGINDGNEQAGFETGLAPGLLIASGGLTNEVNRPWDPADPGEEPTEADGGGRGEPAFWGGRQIELEGVLGEVDAEIAGGRIGRLHPQPGKDERVGTTAQATVRVDESKGGPIPLRAIAFEEGSREERSSPPTVPGPAGPRGRHTSTRRRNEQKEAAGDCRSPKRWRDAVAPLSDFGFRDSDFSRTFASSVPRISAPTDRSDTPTPLNSAPDAT